MGFFGITDTSNNAVQIPALYLNVHTERVTVICEKQNTLLLSL